MTTKIPLKIFTNKSVLNKDISSAQTKNKHTLIDNLSSQKKFTIFANFKFSKKLRYSIISPAALFRLHPPFSRCDVTRLHYF